MITDSESFKLFLKNVTTVPRNLFSKNFLNIVNNKSKLNKYQNLYTWVQKLSLST